MSDYMRRRELNLESVYRHEVSVAWGFCYYGSTAGDLLSLPKPLSLLLATTTNPLASSPGLECTINGNAQL